MNLVHTRVVHEGAGNWVVDFIGDDGEAVSVKVNDDAVTSEDVVVEHARQILVELTGFGTRGAGAGVKRKFRRRRAVRASAPLNVLAASMAQLLSFISIT